MRAWACMTCVQIQLARDRSLAALRRQTCTAGEPGLALHGRQRLKRRIHKQN